MPYYYSYSTPAYEYAPKDLSCHDSMVRLREGNMRFMTDSLRAERFNSSRRRELEEGQSPFATIVSCSDSRIPPEEVFDQGLGELFVIRSAGHVADQVTLGSIEYSVAYLGVRLVVVLGHEDCGAVYATMAGKDCIGYLKSVVKAIEPAVAKVRTITPNDIDRAVVANIEYVVERIRKAKPYLANMVTEKKLHVVGALYTFHDGKVSFLES